MSTLTVCIEAEIDSLKIPSHPDIHYLSCPYAHDGFVSLEISKKESSASRSGLVFSEALIVACGKLLKGEVFSFQKSFNRSVSDIVTSWPISILVGSR